MNAHKLAGKKAPRELLTNIPQLLSAYYTHKPDVENTHNLVSFGTSGHRGSSFKSSFNEDHVLAICQSICELRKSGNITGPLYVGKDTHALSEAAFFTAVEVFAANNIDIMIQTGPGYTPTPVISHTILNIIKTEHQGLRMEWSLLRLTTHQPADRRTLKLPILYRTVPMKYLCTG